MKTHTPKCDRRRIDTFLDSNRVGIEDKALTDHLGGCEDCRAYMESRAANAEAWSSAAIMLRPSAYDQATAVEYSAAHSSSPRTDLSTAIRQVIESLSPTDDPHRLGRLGEYEVTGVIGQGGMGVVLKAVEPSLDRVVAIKVMSPHLAHHATARRRFEREAKAAAAVLHPNIVPIHCVCADEPMPYLVMAYIRGGSLQKRLDHEGPLPTVDILRIGTQVAAGLAAAHGQGLVHRDIKPENILLGEGVERVTLTDFGLARTVDDASVTQTGTITGTPRYMSPEQARGESVDQQSDLFSLGSVLYALCTGRPAFRGDTSFSVMRRITDEAPTPIREVNPGIPDWLAHIVERLMAKNKADRFSSANEVHELLEACLNHAQQPTHTDLPASLLKGLVPTRPRRGMFPLLTSTQGLLIMLSLLTAAALAVAIPSMTDTDTPTTNEIQEGLTGDLKLLQGDWHILKGKEGGESLMRGGSGVLSVKANAITITYVPNEGPEQQLQTKWVELDASGKTKKIDFFDVTGVLRTQGIYQINGDTLRLCMNESVSGERPTTFASPVDTGVTLMECRRVVEAEPKPAEGGLEHNKPNEALKPLQGEWNPAVFIRDGEQQETDKLGQVRIVGNALTFYTKDNEGQEIEELTFWAEVDSTKNPTTIDVFDKNGGLEWVGILDAKDDRLRICWNEVEGDTTIPRPTKFEAPKGSITKVVELNRIDREPENREK